MALETIRNLQLNIDPEAPIEAQHVLQAVSQYRDIYLSDAFKIDLADHLERKVKLENKPVLNNITHNIWFHFVNQLAEQLYKGFGNPELSQNGDHSLLQNLDTTLLYVESQMLPRFTLQDFFDRKSFNKFCSPLIETYLNIDDTMQGAKRSLLEAIKSTVIELTGYHLRVNGYTKLDPKGIETMRSARDVGLTGSFTLRRPIAQAIKYHEESSLKTPISLTAEINFDNSDESKAKIVKQNLVEIQRSILRLLARQNVNLETVCSVSNIWKQLLAKCEGNQDITFAFLNNADALTDQFYKGVEDQEFTLYLPTCPDYSGFYDDGDQFHFNFESLGDEPGVVAEKGWPLMKRLHDILSAYGQVHMNHLLPTFEFSLDGFRGEKEQLTKDQVIEKMTTQARKIESHYQHDLNLNASVKLTHDLIEDEEFWSQRDVLAAEFTANTHGDCKPMLEYIFKKRQALYEKWFPKPPDQPYEEWKAELMKTKVPATLAEYVTLAKIYQTLMHTGGVIGLDCSSKKMNQVAYSGALPGIEALPIIHGYGAQSKNYEGG
jgi:hypothetical protein